MPRRREVPPLVSAIGRQVKHWREQRKWSQRRLAEEVSALGVTLTTPMVASIETDRRDDISVREVFAIAWVLGVPPILLMLPLGREDEVEVLPGMTIHPSTARGWLMGDLSPSYPEAEQFRTLAESWYHAAAPLRLYDRLRIAYADPDLDARRLTLSQAMLDGVEPPAPSEAELATMRYIASVLTRMAEAGVRAPGQPRLIIEDMDRLGIEHPPVRAVLPVIKADMDRLGIEVLPEEADDGAR